MACFLISKPDNHWFLGEDGVIEWASATMDGMAAALATLMLFMRPPRRTDRALMLFVGILGVACFLSEISFGARQLGFSMPAMPGGGQLDGGQDFVMLAKRCFEWLTPDQWLLKMLLVSLLAAVAAFVIRRFQLIRIAVAWQHGNRQRQLVLAAVFLLVIAVGFDTFEQSWTEPFEELSELLAAGLLVASTLASTRHDAPRQRSRGSRGHP
ncbi:hypothetical protein [Croceibacterium ferulae]|uniref:hypothetical protein n=1 Tax=Croceibacterium ferulae TaxID=1854641 RepID=UPI000F87299C|nr:hypothetical protein [Croceibacterium ferulae]